MTVLGGNNGHPKSGNIGAFEEHITPLMVVVHGVVHGHVHGPEVAVLVGVERPVLVFQPLRHTVAGTSVGTVVSSLQPDVCGQRIVREPAHVVKPKRHRSIGLCVGVLVKVGCDVQQGWSHPVDHKFKRGRVKRQHPVLAGASLDVQRRFTRQTLGGVEQRVVGLS